MDQFATRFNKQIAIYLNRVLQHFNSDAYGTLEQAHFKHLMQENLVSPGISKGCQNVRDLCEVLQSYKICHWRSLIGTSLSKMGFYCQECAARTTTLP